MPKINFCPLYLSSQKTPHRIALVTETKKITFNELNDIADQIESHFLENKITSYSKGGVIASNDWRIIILLIVFYRRGIIYLPFNHHKPHFKLLKEICESGCEFVIVDKVSEFKKTHQIELPLLINLSSLPFQLKGKKIRFPSSSIAKGVDNTKKINLTTPALNLYTSGSMGYEKLAVFSLKNIFSNCRISNEFLSYGKDDTWLLTLPLYHISGLSIVFRWLLAGGKIALSIKKAKKNGENKLVKSLKLFKPTHLSLVASQLLTMMREEEKPTLLLLKRVKKILVGGSSISNKIWSLSKKLPLLPTYGLTEAIAQVATYDKRKEHWLKILPSRQLKIDPQNKEILIHRGSMFLKYEKRRKSFSKGWFRTGDLGEIKNNHLKVTGRLDNQFISGGENIQAEEIENSLMDLPAIKKALVLAEEDKTWGKFPLLFSLLITQPKL